MTRKGFFLAAMVTIALLTFAGCLSTPVAKQTYPTGTELYPAVYGTFAELYPKARYSAIDFYNNSYTLTGITGLALTTPVSYDITVRLAQNGELDISYSNIYMYDTNTRRWSKSDSFGFYNYNKAAADISEKMAAIANDPAEFARNEKAAMADIKFIYAIMKKFTGLAFNDFINKYAKGSVFNINGTVSNVKESGKVIDGTTYNYVVTLTEKLTDNIDSSSYFSFLDDYVYCRFYTNQDDVIRLSKTATLSVKGILVGAEQGMGIGADLYLDLVDAR